MRTYFKSWLESPLASLETDVALAQTVALFADVRSFAIGAGGVCLATAVVAFRENSAILSASSGCLGLITVCRLAQLYTFSKLSRRKTVVASRWNRLYNVSAGTHMAAISGYCLCAFLVTADPLSRMLAMASVIAYMAGIPGRNFANPRGVDVQIVCGALPLLTAMIFVGVDYACLTGLLFIPYFIGLRTLARRLRGIFLKSSARARELGEMAETFDTALGNMSHGLAMFDRHAHLTVYNQQLPKLLGLSTNDLSTASFATLFAEAMDTASAISALTSALTSNRLQASFEVAMSSGAILSLTLRAKPGGGTVALVHDVTDEKAAAERIRNLALYDELTGLMNRSHLGRLLEDLPRRSDSCAQALLYVDLDGFKLVNDTLGHLAGDILIRKTAERLLRLVEGRSSVARLGGDEFAILLEGHGDPQKSYDLAAAVIAALREPFEVDGRSVIVGASIGIALYPDDACDGPALLGKADLALYRAKAGGRCRWRRFEIAMELAAEKRRLLQNDLRNAVGANEFELQYQPIFDHRRGMITLCEALVRWRHPTRGLLPPSDFIPLAEETGVIADIGRWVLDRACHDCSLWPDEVAVAVNISAIQFRHGDVVRCVADALSRSQLHPSRLELELTETVLLQDVAFTSLTMGMLHRRGVKICLDDFGTGYSSLSYMNQLPLSRVKIDRSFLTDVGTSERTLLLLKGLVRLVAELGLSSVIEGVETEDQLNAILGAMEVDLLQGFLFSRPIDPAAMRHLLNRSSIDRAPMALAKVG